MALTLVRNTHAEVRCDASKDRCGPADLAELCIARFRQWILTNPNRDPGPNYCAMASDEGIRELVNLAYFASLCVEEGRPVIGRLYLGTVDPEFNPQPVLHSFPSPIPLSDAGRVVHLLMASPRGSSVWIDEGYQGEALRCHGIIDCSELRTSIAGLNTAGATVEVFIDGPGHLRLVLGSVDAVLRRGQIRLNANYDEIPPVWELFSGVSKFIYKHVEAPKNAYLNSSSFSSSVQSCWSQLLISTISRHHGGSFTIIPNESALESFSDGIETDLHLGTDLLRFHQFDLSQGSKLMRLFYSSFPNRSVDALSALANVDGSVVLDRTLRVHLFGAKIKEGTAKFPIVDFYDRSKSLEDAVARLGTRSGSACRFCCSHEGAVAFVISQDGDLRVFCSQDGQGFGFDAAVSR